MNKAKAIKKTHSSKPTSKVKSHSQNEKISKADEQLSAIRNLLFGEQLLKLEQTIQKQYEMLNDRIDDLEQLLTNNSEEFGKKLIAANHDFIENLKTNHLEHVNHENLLDKKITTMNKNLGEFQHTTEKDFVQARDTLAHTAEKINLSLNQEVKRLTEKIDSSSQELSAKKADRKAIASLLENMANNLTQSKA